MKTYIHKGTEKTGKWVETDAGGMKQPTRPQLQNLIEKHAGITKKEFDDFCKVNGLKKPCAKTLEGVEWVALRALQGMIGDLNK